MNISSVLVSARPAMVEQVRNCLRALNGVEVHAVSNDGQLVVTIEADSDQSVASRFTEINQQPGVLSVAMVYHQYESDPDEEA